MSRCAIYLDEGYIRKITREFGHIDLNLRRLSRFLAGSNEILQSYYYYCMPYVNPRNPHTADLEKYRKKQKYIERVAQDSNILVRAGQLAYRGMNAEGRPIYTQKQVDVQLATDLVVAAKDGLIDTAILVSADGDFIPAIEVAKGEGVEFVLAYSNVCSSYPHKGLFEIADRIITIDDKMLRASEQRITGRMA